MYQNYLDRTVFANRAQMNEQTNLRLHQIQHHKLIQENSTEYQ